VRRMRPFARNIEAERRDHGLAVWLLRYRMRGWNGDEMSTLPDARWALDQIRALPTKPPQRPDQLQGLFYGGCLAAGGGPPHHHAEVL